MHIPVLDILRFFCPSSWLHKNIALCSTEEFVLLEKRSCNSNVSRYPDNFPDLITKILPSLSKA